MLELNVPINLFGDIHGHYIDMVRFLIMTGLTPNQKFLFLGDYVDSPNSIEIALLFGMKILYPDKVFILKVIMNVLMLIKDMVFMKNVVNDLMIIMIEKLT